MPYLSDEAVDVPMPEVSRKDFALEGLAILDEKLLSVAQPADDAVVLLTLM